MAAAAVDFPITVRRAGRILGLHNLTLVGVAIMLTAVIATVGYMVIGPSLGVSGIISSTVPSSFDFVLDAGAQSFRQAFVMLLWTAICGVMLEHILEAKRAEREGRY